MVKGHHAVGHVKEEGVQLVPLVFHGGQGGLEDPRHLVEGAGQHADFVRGFHGQRAAEVSGGHFLRPGGELFNGAHHGFGEGEAQEHGNQKADDQGLHDDLEKLAVEAGDGVPVVQDIDDKGVVPPEDGDGGVHVVGGDVADVPDARLVPAQDGVSGGEEVGALLPGHGALGGGAVEIGPRLPVQDEVVPGAVVDAKLSGGKLHHVVDPVGAVVLGGLAPEGGDELPLVRAEDAVDLLVEGVGEEVGDVDGQEGPHHRHEGGNEQQEYQRQLHVQAAEHGGASFLKRAGLLVSSPQNSTPPPGGSG